MVLLFSLFLAFLLAQVVAGFSTFNELIVQKHGTPFTMGEYLTSGHFLEATFENWEAEFLRLALFMFVAGTIYNHVVAQHKQQDVANGEARLLSSQTLLQEKDDIGTLFSLSAVVEHGFFSFIFHILHHAFLW